MAVSPLPAPKVILAKTKPVECGSIKNRSDLYEFATLEDPSSDSGKASYRDHSPVDYYLTIDPSDLKKKAQIGLLIKSVREPDFGIVKYLPKQKKLPISQKDLEIIKVDLKKKDEQIMIQYVIEGELSAATVVPLKDLLCVSKPSEK